MIDRYSRPEMAKIWTLQNKYEKWLQIELAVCEALLEKGDIPKSAFDTIKNNARFETSRIDEIERTVKHDVIAFLTNISENVGNNSRYIHMGITSSDLLDTALALVMVEASDIILTDLKALSKVLMKRAFEFKDTMMIGRSHGVHAEPITFGLKLALWYSENQRNIKRMENAKESIGYGKISGAVGTFANIDPFVEEYVCKKFGLKPAPVSNQIIQRDRHAEFMVMLSLIASSIEKISVELRHLQRTEVLEAEEYFSTGQKGSSAMPHKRNPITAEQLSGLARVIRSHAVAAMENIALWHERDISHSSVERIILPDSTILIDYMLNKLIDLIEKLLIYPQNMKKNLDKMGGLIYSENMLLELVKSGLTREEAYKLVQRASMKIWEKGGDFKESILNDREIMKYISAATVEKVFSISHHLKNVDFIFRRVFGRVEQV
ncbi:MAG: adenylosuccinate lyase [Nitrospinota bacterium]